MGKAKRMLSPVTGKRRGGVIQILPDLDQCQDTVPGKQLTGKHGKTEQCAKKPTYLVEDRFTGVIRSMCSECYLTLMGRVDASSKYNITTIKGEHEKGTTIPGDIFRHPLARGTV